MEDDDLVDPVDELRPEMLAQLDRDRVLDDLRIVQLLVGGEPPDLARAQVRRHHDDGVAEVDGAAVAAGQRTGLLVADVARS